jgi:RHS repeat-associated protein
MRIHRMSSFQLTSLLTAAVLLQSTLVAPASAQEQRREAPQKILVAANRPSRPAHAVPLLAAAKKPLGVAAQIAATILVGQSTTLLPDGRLLSLGGADVSGPLARGLVKNSTDASTSSPVSGLQHARAWHTATVLPDGTVFIFGGVGAKTLVNEAELFDPATQSFREIAANLKGRAYHTATLLTDGRLLIAGGIGSDGKPLARLDIWDPRSNKAQTLAAPMLSARRGHTATLQSDGSVLIQGGVLADRSSAAQAEVFHPDTQTIEAADNATVQDVRDVPHVMASIPSDGATNVPVDAVMSLRFSKLLGVATVNMSTVTLTAPGGQLSGKVAAAEGGRLAFLTPGTPLQPATTYTLSIAGATDLQDMSIQQTQIQFTTGAAVDPASGDGTAKPADKDDPPVPPLKAGPGVTALSGQVRTVAGKYLSQVTLELNCGEEKGKRNRTASEGTGRFLLANIPDGHCKLEIDGTTVHLGSDVYGIFTPGVDITKGITNILSYIIWMTPLDITHAVTIPSTTTGEFVVTNPAIPGLELHLPPNATVKDYDGNIVTRISITRIPIARPPFPLPGGVQVPFYFTIQPGGAYISVTGTGAQGAQLFYPNQVRAPAGFRFSFWNYDPDNKGWFVYGKGTVGASRRYVVPDPGVFIYQFTGAMVADPGCNTCGPNPPPPPPCPPDCPDPHGDPIDSSSGLFLYSATDFSTPDVVPLTLTRMYRQTDPISRPFGVGMSHNYEMYLVGDRYPYTYADIILADGSRVHYTQIGDGSGFGSSVFQTTQNTAFYMTKIVFSNNGWLLTLQDGTQWQFPAGDGATFPAQTAPLFMRDRFGNAVTFTRDPANGNLLKATSPNGRWISFTYDSSNRITAATDNSGRQYQYSYDVGGRLATVTNPLNGLTQYTYDYNNQMLTISDPRGITYVSNQYDTNGRVVQQTLANGGLWQFAYTQDVNGNIVQTDITNPRGFVDRVTLDTNGYFSGGRVLSTTRALGQPEQQISTSQYDPVTGLLQSTTDALNRITTYTYDPRGNIASITRLAGTPEQGVDTFAYDPTFNQPTSHTNAAQKTTLFNSDSLARLTAIIDPLNHAVTFTPGSDGRPQSIQFPGMTATTVGYMGADLTSVTSPYGTMSRVTDPLGRSASITDPRGSTVGFKHNALNRVTERADALGATTFEYDANASRTAATDVLGKRTAYVYDRADELFHRIDALGNADEFLYDSLGNLVQYKNRNGQIIAAQYDALNRLSLLTFADNSTITYSYDRGDRQIQIVDSLYGTITRTYDGRDNILTETSPQGGVSYNYDLLGQRTAMTVAGQLVVSYGYDDATRLSTVTQGGITATMAYDGGNRPVSRSLSTGLQEQIIWSGAYVSEIRYSQAGLFIGNITYTHDSGGKRTQIGGSLAKVNLPNPVANASYNDAHRLTQFGGSNLTYDNAGNLLTDGSSTYSWDARGQLASIAGSASASLQYDPLGRRVNVSGTSEMYDGWNIASQSTSTNTSLTVFGDALDDGIWRTDGSGTQYFVRDAINTVIGLSDQSGNLTTQYSYEPFGKTSVSGTSSNTFEFTGRENDGTGLYFSRSRYYSPTLQRFISEDPLEFVNGPNRYAYAGNDPVNNVDPDGLSTTVVFYPTGSTHIVIRPGDSGDFSGFWPDPTNNLATGLACMFVPCGEPHKAEVEGPNGNRFPHPQRVTIPTTPEQEEMMRKFITHWKEHYNLIHRNCADFVLRTLEAAGFRVKWWLVNRRADPMTGQWVFDVLKSGWYDIN